MIKLVFVLLNDVNSENTINILYFLNEYVNELNKKKYIIEIILIKKENIDTDDFKKFRESHNIQSIPSLIIVEHDKYNTISNADNVASYLEQIIMQKNNRKNENKYDNDNESDNENNIQNYLNNEICNKDFDKDENILSSGHSDSVLMKKMKDFNTKKGIEIPNTDSKKNMNLNNNSDDNLDENDKYSNKLLNKAQKKEKLKNAIKKELNNNSNGDDDLISKKFLDNIDSD